MIDLKAFRRANCITQNDLALFLGVGQGFISQIEKGDRKLPSEYIGKLLANTNGWDTTILTGNTMTEYRPDYSPVECLLRDILAEKEAKIDALQEYIWELKEENGRLKEQIGSAKGGSVPIVSASSSANVG